MADTLLDRMRRNPKGDWRIEDVETLCRQNGLIFRPPNKGSHAVVKHPKLRFLVTVPFKRPIKPVYIKRVILLIELGLKA